MSYQFFLQTLLAGQCSALNTREYAQMHSWFHSRVKYFCLRRGSSYFQTLMVCQGKTARERAFRKLIQLDGNENVRRREWPRCGCRPAILHARTCVRYATGMQTLRNNYYNAVDRDCVEKSPVHVCVYTCTVIARALMACMHLASRRYTLHGNSA